MNGIVADKSLVAYCGLYCGACRAYRKGKCPGCMKNGKASWCKVRTCTMKNNYTSCADCTIVVDCMQCKAYNNFMAKIFGFIFRSDRAACIARIKEIGTEKFAGEMAQKGMQTISKK